MKVLITAGGTEEPIDGVRRLTNLSTGATGNELARHFAERGAEVCLLHAARSQPVDAPVEQHEFVTFGDLERILEHHLAERHWDAVVHLAAVGDYSVASVEVDGCEMSPPSVGKIGTGREVVIRLSANPKLIDSFRHWSRNPEICVVGFKLTDDPEPKSREAQVRGFRERGVADLVVHNDVREIAGERHVATIHDAHGRIIRTESKEQLANELWELISTQPSRA